ncbi:MAG: universal stress protein, partial [Candidatus Methylomirabilis sp.]|nr:universal stress protein [Deltaproteobacteria bacterium]
SCAAREGGATVFAAHEYDIAGLAAATDEGFDAAARRAYQDRAQAEEQARLADFLAEMGPLPVRPTPVALRGREGWEAAEFARREGADLLVMAAPRRRLGFLDKLFQHGVEFALERLPCALWLHRHD